ncbi:hypothetical protein [Qipengyuania aquimaris]|uniref:hypothetical protein n=1 Tax=Qipengyuania aquimaris TaxID=255984 RepID=UPI001CD5D0FD|nr:hypothetical protein [Qipengyuania aquimaris]MCA0902476.1 hypothetical protein [Qipengyuania aquimaris]
MSYWSKRACETLLPLSNADALKAALQEWFYTGSCSEFECCSETCELCGQDGLRYHFEIANSENGNTLSVGSECIKRFEIRAIDHDGSKLSIAETAQLLDIDRRKLVEDARKRRALEAIRQLQEKMPEFIAERALTKMSNSGSFSPLQAAFLLEKFDFFGIPFRFGDYKISIRSSAEKDELRDMSEHRLRLAWHALTPQQRKSIHNYREKVELNGERWR